ncbi:MAG: hypothetical protein Q9214_003295 [Letrouitia sp. 1 TL-2023]
MHSSSFKTFLVVFAFGLLACSTLAGTIDDAPLQNHVHGLGSRGLSDRRLVAAQTKSSISARSIENALKYDHELHYVDESAPCHPQKLAAQVKFSSKTPILALEEIEHLLEDVSCRDSSIALRFTSLDALNIAHAELGKHDSFVIITSHATCNNEGERSPHRVSGFSKKESRLSLTLSTTQSEWKHTMHTIKVDFGRTDADYNVRTHSRKQKRQDAASTTGEPSAAISFPVPSASATAGPEGTPQDLGFNYTDTTILPPQFPGADNINIEGVLLIRERSPPGVNIKCKNCTLSGTIDLFGGSFSVQSNESADVMDFIEDGFIELQANNLAAYMEFESNVQPSDGREFTIPFPEIGIPGFQIPGIGVVGPIFNPRVAIGAEISAQLDFTYGFQLTLIWVLSTLKVPNNSSIIIAVGASTENSSIQGFPDAKIDALPFQASVQSVALTIFAAFSPQLLLGISLLGNTENAGAGVFFTLPRVSATVSQVTQVNSKCEPTNNSTGKDLLDDFFDGLTHIEPKVELGFGLIAEASLDIDVINVGAETIYTVANTSFPLPTACYSFDTDEKTFGPATAQAITTGSGPGPKIGAASAQMLNPLTGLIDGWKRVEVAVTVLFGVLICFTGL